MKKLHFKIYVLDLLICWVGLHMEKAVSKEEGGFRGLQVVS